jgi:hypothetical protein
MDDFTGWKSNYYFWIFVAMAVAGVIMLVVAIPMQTVEASLLPDINITSMIISIVILVIIGICLALGYYGFNKYLDDKTNTIGMIIGIVCSSVAMVLLLLSVFSIIPFSMLLEVEAVFSIDLTVFTTSITMIIVWIINLFIVYNSLRVFMNQKPEERSYHSLIIGLVFIGVTVLLLILSLTQIIPFNLVF